MYTAGMQLVTVVLAVVYILLVNTTFTKCYTIHYATDSLRLLRRVDLYELVESKNFLDDREDDGEYDENDEVP